MHMDLIKFLFLPSLFFLFLLLKLISRCASPSHTDQPRALRLPPGPWQLPLIGSLHHLLLSRFRDRPHRAMLELSLMHGPLMLLRLGSVPTLVVSSAEAAREVLKTHDAAFCSRHLSATLGVISCGGQGLLFAPYGEPWRELRKVCARDLFGHRRVLSFRPIREDEVASLVRSVSVSGGGGGGRRLVNLSEEISRAMIATIARAVVGRRCRRQEEFLRYMNKAIQVSGERVNLANLYPSSRLMRLLSVNTRRLAWCQKKLYRITESIIREHAVESSAQEQDQEEDLLSVLLRLQKDGGLQFPLTTGIISTVIFDIFAAGSDTSSTTLDWAMAELMKNPRVLHKAQLEVREAFKGKSHLNEEDMAKLNYIQLVIKETLRLHPPVPLLIPRECRETCQVMGFDIAKGTRVLVNVWPIGRDEKYWDDPHVFKPERFENSSVDFKGANLEYIPFGAGRRMCPGITLGLANMELAQRPQYTQYTVAEARVNCTQYTVAEARDNVSYFLAKKVYTIDRWVKKYKKHDRQMGKEL